MKKHIQVESLGFETIDGVYCRKFSITQMIEFSKNPEPGTSTKAFKYTMFSMHVYKYVRMYEFTSTHTRMYTHKNTHTQTRTHTHTGRKGGSGKSALIIFVWENYGARSLHRIEMMSNAWVVSELIPITHEVM